MKNNNTRYREFASIPKRRNSTNVLKLYFQISMELSLSYSDKFHKYDDNCHMKIIFIFITNKNLHSYFSFYLILT